MRIIIEKDNFLEGVQRIQSVVDRKNTIPVLSNILLDADAEKNTVLLTATNLEVGMSTSLPLSETTGGSITIPAQKLFEILKELPETSVTLTSDENNWITVECLKSNFRIAGLPKADFPELPNLPSQDMLIFQQALLKDLIGKTAFAVSHDESRYALTGVLFSISSHEVSMVATDGHRLAVIKRPHNFEFGDTTREAIIPLKAIAEVKKLCDAGGQISINFSESQVAFRRTETLLVSRLIDAQFPDYRQVIPNESRHTITIPKEQLYRAVRRVSLLCSDTRLVKFSIGNEQLNLSSNDPNLGEAKEMLPIEYNGEEISIGFNAKYVLEFLSVASGENVRIGVNDSLSPGLFTSDAQEDFGFSCVIMPMRI